MKTQIGLLFVGFDKKTKDSLGYLFTYLNKVQNSFEYIIGPNPSIHFGEQEIIQALTSNKIASQEYIDTHLDGFYKKYINSRIKFSYPETTQAHYKKLIILCENKLDTNYYVTKSLKNPISLIACGSFHQVFHSMNKIQPVITIAVLLSIRFLALDTPKGEILRSHIETKGCLLDFNPDLHSIKFKILNGYLCESCIENLNKLDNATEILALQSLFTWNWLGEEDKAGTPANIVSKLGGKLFVTSGLDKLNQLLKEESIKSILEIVKILVLTVLATILATHHIELH